MRAFVCLLLTITVAALFAAELTLPLLYAGHGGCVLCGCEPCEKVCRLVCEEKKITVTCWGFKDEDFCVPGRSECIDKNCEMVCDESDDPATLCSQPRRMVWFDWRPKGGPTIYTKRKLMRKTVTRKVPSYRWVIQDLCEECRLKEEEQPAPAAESKPVKDDDKSRKASDKTPRPSAATGATQRDDGQY